MKKIKKFGNFINEISRELVDRTSDAMIDRGQNKRAKTLITNYNNANYNFDDFIGKELFGDHIKRIRIIDSIKVGDEKFNKKENEQIEIFLSNNREYNTSSSTINYDILNDEYLYLPNNISRRDVRLLGKIAQVMNPDTKYLKGTDGIKIIGY